MEMELETQIGTFLVGSTPDAKVLLSLYGLEEQPIPATLTLAGDEARDLADMLATVGCAVDGLFYGGMVVAEDSIPLNDEEREYEPDDNEDYPLYLEYELPGMAGDFYVEQDYGDDW